MLNNATYFAIPGANMWFLGIGKHKNPWAWEYFD